ncbi:MAG: hypothetical protein IPN76_30970 [Saprospiraceae bacterium]|nr:hypothetical protein [Saprospiraceae bacterium]
MRQPRTALATTPSWIGPTITLPIPHPGTDPIPAPPNWLFDYRLVDNDVKLLWRTARAEHRLSASSAARMAGNFSPIAWVDGSAFTTAPKDYYYDDKDLRSGNTHYYRPAIGHRLRLVRLVR